MSTMIFQVYTKLSMSVVKTHFLPDQSILTSYIGPFCAEAFHVLYIDLNYLNYESNIEINRLNGVVNFIAMNHTRLRSK